MPAVSRASCLLVLGLALAPGAHAATGAGGREVAAPAVRPSPVAGATDTWSEKRIYRVSYAPTPVPVPMLALHSWTLTIRDAAGHPVDDAHVTVLGGMPAHAHGLPTTPAVRTLGEGRYLVEGLKFHMPGAWVVAFRINARPGIDSATFALDLP